MEPQSISSDINDQKQIFPTLEIDTSLRTDEAERQGIKESPLYFEQERKVDSGLTAKKAQHQCKLLYETLVLRATKSKEPIFQEDCLSDLKIGSLELFKEQSVPILFETILNKVDYASE